MRFLIITASLFLAVNSWLCPPGDPKNPVVLTGSQFPVAGENTTFDQNLNCIFEIPVSPGQYVIIDVGGNLTDTQDSLIFTDASGLNIKFDSTSRPQIVSPVAVTISFKSGAQPLGGTLLFLWTFANVPFKGPIESTVTPGEIGTIMFSQTIYIASYVVSSDSSIALLATPSWRAAKEVNSLMMSIFVFDGEGVKGKYLGSLYTMMNKGAFNTGSTKITVVSVTPFDVGAALAKPYSEVKDYNYLFFNQNDLEDTLTLDATDKPTAVTLYDNGASDFFISKPLYQNGDGILEWHPEDLLALSTSIASYGKGSDLESFPQALPGYMKTLIVRKDKISVSVSVDKPKVFNNVQHGMSGFFSSKNYFSPNMSQKNSIVFKSSRRMNMSFSAVSAYENTYFNAKITDVDGNSQTHSVYPKRTVNLLGTKFEIDYPADEGSGGLSSFSFSSSEIVPSDGTWNCPEGKTVLLTGNRFPPQGSSTMTQPNLNCVFEIPVPDGQYIQLSTDQTYFSEDRDSLVFVDDSGLNVKFDITTNPTIVSPRTITIYFKTGAQSAGETLLFMWNFNPVPFTLPMRSQLASSRVGTLMNTDIIYKNSYVVSCNSSIALLAAAPLNSPNNFLMMNTFVYDGEGINGDYLGSLYSIMQSGVFNTQSKTITLVSVSPLDVGVALAKPFSDVQEFNYRLVYQQDVENTLALNGNEKPTAVTLYSPGASDFFIFKPTFSNGNGWLEWQSEDLRPYTLKITSYEKSSPLNKLPQALPGYMKTLIARNDNITVSVSSDRPVEFDQISKGMSGIFTSRNFLAPLMVQKNSIIFNAVERINMTFAAKSAYNNTFFTVKTTDGSNGATTNNVQSAETRNFLGTKFEISYSVDDTFHTSGGLSTFSFADITTKSVAGYGIPLLFVTLIFSFII